MRIFNILNTDWCCFWFRDGLLPVRKYRSWFSSSLSVHPSCIIKWYLRIKRLMNKKDHVSQDETLTLPSDAVNLSFSAAAAAAPSGNNQTDADGPVRGWTRRAALNHRCVYRTSAAAATDTLSSDPSPRRRFLAEPRAVDHQHRLYGTSINPSLRSLTPTAKSRSSSVDGGW